MNSTVFTSHHPYGPVLYVKQEENGCLYFHLNLSIVNLKEISIALSCRLKSTA